MGLHEFRQAFYLSENEAAHQSTFNMAKSAAIVLFGKCRSGSKGVRAGDVEGILKYPDRCGEQPGKRPPAARARKRSSANCFCAFAPAQTWDARLELQWSFLETASYSNMATRPYPCLYIKTDAASSALFCSAVRPRRRRCLRAHCPAYAEPRSPCHRLCPACSCPGPEDVGWLPG